MEPSTDTADNVTPILESRIQITHKTMANGLSTIEFQLMDYTAAGTTRPILEFMECTQYLHSTCKTRPIMESRILITPTLYQIYSEIQSTLLQYRPILEPRILIYNKSTPSTYNVTPILESRIWSSNWIYTS